jgi:hypothetical protein
MRILSPKGGQFQKRYIGSRGNRDQSSSKFARVANKEECQSTRSGLLNPGLDQFPLAGHGDRVVASCPIPASKKIEDRLKEIRLIPPREFRDMFLMPRS